MSHKHQSLQTHLCGVTKIASSLYDLQCDNPEMRDVIEKVCMAHDFAKGTTFFQEYVMCPVEEQKTRVFGENKNHALLSALFTYWCLPDKYKLWGFLAVKRHHGNTGDGRDEFNITENDFAVLEEQIADIKKNTQAELEDIYSVRLDAFLDFVNKKTIKEIRDKFRKAFIKKFLFSENTKYNYIYGILLAADKMQLIDGLPPVPKHKSCNIVETYKNKIRDIALDKNPLIAHSKIFQVRNDIFRDLQAELERIDLMTESFFSINVPTGSGKTFLGYYAGLYLAKKMEDIFEKQVRIIYSLPFMSIIDQNCDELVKIFRDDNGNIEPDDNVILKHHSLAEIKYKTEEKEYEDFDAEFYYKNWNSGIVVTTFVQLLNTIFKIGDKTIAQRFNRLANSIIILDEVQAIDEKFYPVINQMFQILAKEYNVKFIFVTATMPMLTQARELIPGREKYFLCLNRITMHNHTKDVTTFGDFVNIAERDVVAKPEKSFLFVMNTISSARMLYRSLKKTGRKCICLSTEIYPKARLEIIAQIKNSENKDSKTKPIVVSTQLIEAGVDIDMDIVYRDFAPLSSLNQTAGRANRNGLGETQSEVHIYRLVDEHNTMYCTKIYPGFLLEITRELLQSEVIQESEIYDLNIEYARMTNERLSTDKSNAIMQHIKNFDVEKLRKSFNLIRNDSAFKHEIFIVDDAESERLIQQLKSIKNTYDDKWKMRFKIQDTFRRLNTYRIGIYDRSYNLIQGNLKTVEAFDIEYLIAKENGRVFYSIEDGINYETIMG